MEFEKLIRKLEPLATKKVNHLLRVREAADPRMKTMIESHLTQEAYRRLGNFRNKILLSLPPENKSGGAFHLGKIQYEQEKWDFGLSSKELNRNLGIFGMSGAGKTNVTFLLLEQLVERGMPFLYLDWKRTARHLLPRLRKKVNVYTVGRSLSPLAFNPFVPPPGVERQTYINLLVDTLASAYTLGDGAKSLLQAAIADSLESSDGAVSISDVIDSVNRRPTSDRSRGWQATAMRALQSLQHSQVVSSINIVEQKETIATLCNSHTIIELDGLDQNAKQFLIPMLCLWVYHYHLREPEREKLKQVIFVEEAHHVFLRQEHRAKESAMDMLMRQCREIGIGMVVVDQHPHLISSAALGNTYSTICLNLKDPSDINKAASLSLIDDGDKKYFSMLPVGQGIVKMQDRWRKPFLVRFPLVSIDKGGMTDEKLAKYLLGTADSGVLGRNNHDFGQVRRVLSPDNVFNDEALTFLEDVVSHPQDGVKARYTRLGISIYSGNSLKERLIKQGWLEDEVIPIGKSRKVILRLTPKAKEIFEITSDGETRRESIAHEYWKRHYAELYRQKGYDVQVEAPRRRGGGRVDVLATKDSKQTAIEIETGKSDVFENVRRNLLSSYDKIIVVATSNGGLVSVNRSLWESGLSESQRVHVCSTKDDRGGPP